MTNDTFEKIKSQITFDSQGLVPAIVQDAKTREVLTLCYMNEASLKATLQTGFVHLFRRSRQKLMKKGETSGHTQAVREFRVDCEGKSVLFRVDQKVAACHKGYFSCYFETVRDDGSRKITESRVFDPEKVY